VSRFRIGGLVGCSALVLIVLTGTSSPRPLELTAPQVTARLGITATDAGAALVRLNPVTLKRVGRPLDLRGFAGVWAFAPDNRRLALSVRVRSEAYTETLRFYTVAKPRRSGPGVALGGTAAALWWPRADRILAYVNECCNDPNGMSVVLTIDTEGRRVLSRTPIDGSVLQVDVSRDSVVLLVSPRNRIGPSRLELFDADGVHRSAKLDDIPAGYTFFSDEQVETPGTRLIPGLAIDATGNQAFVVATGGLVAQIDLGSLAVSYRRPVEPRYALHRFARWLTPAAEAKGQTGPALSARWLGGGFLAVSGTAEFATVVGDNLRISSQPLGLKIVDVRDWGAYLLDPRADSFAVANGLLLATGYSWSGEPQKESGMGLAAYGADWGRRFQLLPAKPVWIGFVYRGRAYVSVVGQTALRIVDLASGLTVGTRRPEAPWPLLDDSVRLFG
jgi:hypothetical protein